MDGSVVIPGTGETTAKLVGEVLNDIFTRSMTESEYHELLKALVVVGIFAYRTEFGDEAAKGFLEGATEDLEKPAGIVVKPINIIRDEVMH